MKKFLWYIFMLTLIFFAQSAADTNVPMNEDDAMLELGRQLTRQSYSGAVSLYTSADFTQPTNFNRPLSVLTNITWLQLLRGEILHRNGYEFKQDVFKRIFGMTAWANVKAVGTYLFTNLTANERENLDRLGKIEKEGYEIGFWDDVTDDQLRTIKATIKADDLFRQKDTFYVRFYFPFGVGVKDNAVEWVTNLKYIGEVKRLSRNLIQDLLKKSQTYTAPQESLLQRMADFKETSKVTYETRLKAAQEVISNINEAEKLGGPFIPQGTVIYNPTGKKYQPKILSYADPNWIGVHAPVQDFQEGKQELYSYDATSLGDFSIISKKFVELGTAIGSAVFNMEEGFLEYVSSLPNIYKLDRKGKVIYDTLNNTAVINERLPEYLGESQRYKYDYSSDKTFGLFLDSEGGWYACSVYSNLIWYSGYIYRKKNKVNVESYNIKNMIALITTKEKLVFQVKPRHFGSLIYINGDLYIGNVAIKGFLGMIGYLYLSSFDVFLGKNGTNGWNYDPANQAAMLVSQDETIYPGIPSYSDLPYAYDWNKNPESKEGMWIDIYPIRSQTSLRRIEVKDLKIGDILLDYLVEKKSKRLYSRPEVKSLDFLGDDSSGWIYFEARLDWDAYDFLPLVIAVDREGRLKLVARLWSASGDIRAVGNGAKMGPAFYDTRTVIRNDGMVFSVWNDSKGFGCGRFLVNK